LVGALHIADDDGGARDSEESGLEAVERGGEEGKEGIEGRGRDVHRG
jgi:hypothetical protein